MATGLSYSRDNIIDAALRRVRAVASGETPSTQVRTDTSIILNGLVKVLDGVKEMTTKRDTAKKTVSIAAGDKSVAAAAAVLTVEGAQYVNGTTGTVHPLVPMTRTQWIDTGNDKTTPARDTPTHYYVTNNGGTKSIYVYPSPSANGSIDYWSRDQTDVFDSTSDTSDLPDRYTLWLIFQLAADIGFDHQLRLEEIDRLQGRADWAWKVALNAEGEQQEIDVDPRELSPRR